MPVSAAVLTSSVYTVDMKLIFAQGNPASEYRTTRHNTGFIVMDEFAASHSAVFQPKDRFKAAIAETEINGEKVLLAKPLTYYNETGQSARAIIDFYKLDPATDVLVIHDELALPFGTIRSRGQGSDAGNNGIKSLNAHIGSHYHRLRIGIANPDLSDRDAADFVLGRFTPEEQTKLPELITKATQAIDDFIAGELQHTTI